MKIFWNRSYCKIHIEAISRIPLPFQGQFAYYKTLLPFPIMPLMYVSV